MIRLFIFLLLLNAGCSVNKNPFSQNRSSAYQFDQNRFLSGMDFFALDEKYVRLETKIPGRHLALLPDLEGEKPRRRLVVRASFYPEFKKRKHVLLSPIIIESTATDDSIEFIARLKIPLSLGHEGLLKIEARDLQSKKGVIIYKNISRKTIDSDLDFRVQQKGISNFQGWIHEGIPIRISFWDSTQTEFILSEFPKFKQLPLPPFSLNDSPKESFQAVSQTKINQASLDSLVINKEKILRVSSSKHPENGLILSVVEQDFPSFLREEVAFESHLFLMQKKEKQNNTSKSITEFWAMIGLNSLQIQSIEKAWTERIKQTNMLFTAYNLGWRTDRGMIYTIFGAPNTVYNNGKAEEWNYISSKGKPPLTFRFERCSHDFSHEEYCLVRKSEYATYWYKAIETWRNGTPYTYE
jgi:GWxTD domain-containing protein